MYVDKLKFLSSRKDSKTILLMCCQHIRSYNIEIDFLTMKILNVSKNVLSENVNDEWVL